MEKEIEYGTESFGTDTIPMHELNEEIIIENVGFDKSKENFWSEIKNSTIIRSQIKRSVCVSYAYMIRGWTKGQIGPAFPDIMMISGADLESGSTFMTSLYTGQLLGSVLIGAIASKMNTNLLFLCALVMYSVVLAVIPWCYTYELMLAAHAFLGVSGGVVSVVLDSESVTIWGPTQRGRSYLMGHSAVYAIASVIAPLVAAPFLLKHSSYNRTDTTYASWNTTASTLTFVTNINKFSLHGMEMSNNSFTTEMSNNSLKTELSNNSFTTITQSGSKLYIVYTISAALSILTVALFFILFRQQGQTRKEKSNHGKLKFIGKRSSLLNRLQLLNASIFCVVQNAIDFTFTGYLVVFCIDYLGWTNTFGAMLTSVAFFSRLLGTLSGVCLVRYSQPHQMLLISTIVSTAGFVGLTISAHAYFDAGIWISVCAIGIPFGLTWPNMISWVNEKSHSIR